MHPNDPHLRSFIDVKPESDFPIQNLPYGVFSTAADPTPRVGVAIGEFVLDLAALQAARLFDLPDGVFAQGSINAFMALGPSVWSTTRARISELLRHDHAELRDDAALRAKALLPMREANLHLPLRVQGFTDFFASKEHATNAGAMFRDKTNPLMPNWLHIPIGYNGRASTVVVSGTKVHRPHGQLKPPSAELPSFAPCKRLDFELEIGVVIGQSSVMGKRLTEAQAEQMIFGFTLLNDWSARDIQQWEYVPLGPFNSKGFATTISPWVVTLDALEPFRVQQPAQEPEPLAYLRHGGRHAFDIALEVRLRPEGAREATTICRTNFRHMYWTMAQQLAHHTVAGCNTRVGDLMGSGTISGPTEDSSGSLLELTWNGKRPVALKEGGTRSFIEDGDELTLAGWCEGDGYRVGFGSCVGRILPALPVSQ